MAFDCHCITDEQRKLLLQAIGVSIVEHRTHIDIWKTEPDIKKIEDIAVPHHEEQIQKLEEIERELKELRTCGVL